MSFTVTATPTREQELAHKTVLITGASGGIGAACAAACAGAGATTVALLARSADGLEAAARTVEAAGAEPIVLACDVTDTAALAATIAGLDAVDVLINAAGANQPEPFLAVEEDTFDRLWELNVKATFFAAQAVARRLVSEQRPGVIVNISSQMGHVGGARRTVYCMSKHCIEGLAKAMAIDLAPHVARKRRIDVALSNSFGFGGTNASLIFRRAA